MKLTLPRAPFAPKPVDGPVQPPIQVESRFIPYVESLWLRLTEVREGARSKREYLSAAEATGVRIAATTAVARHLISDEYAAREATSDLERIKRLLALGCEPTQPPHQWLCGHLVEPKKDQYDRYPNETWPCSNRTYQSQVFVGAIPVEALQKYAAVKPLLDGARVYSPNREDFVELRNPVPIDPVLIGLVTFLGERQFFEVARWDVDKDLATLFSRLGG